MAETLRQRPLSENPVYQAFQTKAAAADMIVTPISLTDLEQGGGIENLKITWGPLVEDEETNGFTTTPAGVEVRSVLVGTQQREVTTKGYVQVLTYNVGDPEKPGSDSGAVILLADLQAGKVSLTFAQEPGAAKPNSPSSEYMQARPTFQTSLLNMTTNGKKFPGVDVTGLLNLGNADGGRLYSQTRGGVVLVDSSQEDFASVGQWFDIADVAQVYNEEPRIMNPFLRELFGRLQGIRLSEAQSQAQSLWQERESLRGALMGAEDVLLVTQAKLERARAELAALQEARQIPPKRPATSGRDIIDGAGFLAILEGVGRRLDEERKQKEAASTLKKRQKGDMVHRASKLLYDVHDKGIPVPHWITKGLHRITAFRRPEGADDALLADGSRVAYMHIPALGVKRMSRVVISQGVSLEQLERYQPGILAEMTRRNAEQGGSIYNIRVVSPDEFTSVVPSSHELVFAWKDNVLQVSPRQQQA
ncbi:MAG TPA: hypothetical protein VFQ63_02745 [Patescibacteria group bacterium]|nr:hypothetical protein [Patescibacteria group bacterium]